MLPVLMMCRPSRKNSLALALLSRSTLNNKPPNSPLHWLAACHKPQASKLTLALDSCSTLNQKPPSSPTLALDSH
eukprot:361083-Chlamydomonas_euryale.AAC.1